MVQTTARPVRTVFFTARITTEAARASSPEVGSSLPQGGVERCMRVECRRRGMGAAKRAGVGRCVWLWAEVVVVCEWFGVGGLQRWGWTANAAGADVAGPAQAEALPLVTTTRTVWPGKKGKTASRPSLVRTQRTAQAQPHTHSGPGLT